MERGISEPDLPPLRIVDPITLQDKEVPTRKWLVPEWIPHGTVVALYGDGGTGKSLLAQMLMTSVALGRPWLGLDTQRVRALGIFCEDTEDELWRRQADINRLLGCSFGDLEDMRWISRVGDDNVLAHHHPTGAFELTGFLAQIRAALRDFGAQLLAVDTAADTFGGNENIRSQVRQYISGALGNIARDCDATILLCAHPSVAGINNGTGAGGSTAWSNSVRTRLYLTRPSDEAGRLSTDIRRILSKKKANYSSIGDELRLQWKDGVFVGDVTREKTGAKAAFLKCLVALLEQKFEPSFTAASRENYAPKLMRNRPEVSGFGFGELKAAMESLFTSGEIKFSYTDGPPSRRKKIIVPTDWPGPP